MRPRSDSRAEYCDRQEAHRKHCKQLLRDHGFGHCVETSNPNSTLRLNSLGGFLPRCTATQAGMIPRSGLFPVRDPEYEPPRSVRHCRAQLDDFNAEDVFPLLSSLHSFLGFYEDITRQVVLLFHHSFPDFTIDLVRCVGNPRCPIMSSSSYVTPLCSPSSRIYSTSI